MKIYVFEDSLKEQQAARKAIEDAGHQAIIPEYLAFRAMTEEEMLQWVIDSGLVEKQKHPELEKALAYFKLPEMSKLAEEYRKVLKDMLVQEDVAIITDLMFKNVGKWGRWEGLQPFGLTIVAHGVGHSIPVVLCTNCEGESHHGQVAGFIYDSYLQTFPQPTFKMVDDKNWDEAVRMVTEKIGG